MEHKETSAEAPDAKFARIAEEIRTNAEWRKLLAGEYRDELKALDEIAKRYGGESWNTGGGIYVAVIPLGPHDALGVTGEVICRYHNSKATRMEELFDEPETGNFRIHADPLPAPHENRLEEDELEKDDPPPPARARFWPCRGAADL